MSENAPASGHALRLDGRSLLSVDGVSKVESFDREHLLLVTTLGLLEVRGTDLHIRALDLEGGHCQVEGKVDELSYRQSATTTHRVSGLRRFLR